MNNIFKVFPVLLNELKKDFPFYGVIIASFGGVNQAFFLLQSPSLLSFYSIRQGIIDGALSLIFVIISLILMSVTLKISELTITYINKKVTYILHSLSISVIIMYILLVGWSYEKFYLLLFCILILYASASIPYLDVDEESDLKNPKATLPVVVTLLCFALILFHVYLYEQHKDSSKIQNFSKMQTELSKNNNKYVMKYFNSDYIFLYNTQTNKYKVIPVEEALKF